jgi:outer membrane receptor protein involved in Fe transport
MRKAFIGIRSQSGSQRNNQSNFFERLNYNQPDFRQYNESGTTEHTAQVDYVHPLKVLNIEAGAKAIYRNNYSHFTTDYYSDATKNYINDPAQTNDFDYQQNVYSIYNSYNLKLKKTVLKGGLRLEHTTIDAHFISTSSAVKQNYRNLVPSFAIQRTLNESNSMTFGYSQRIQRPGIWQLNPFIDRSNPKFINVGNPNLQPVVNRSFELGFSNFKKGSINPSVSYSFANNTVEQVTSVGADTVTISTSQNVGSNKHLSFDLNMNYPITKKLSININAELMYVWLKGTYNNQFYYNKGYQGHLFTNTGYKFNKGYRLNLNAGFDSRYVLLQGRDNYYPSFSLSGSKTLWNEKGTISVFVNNPHQKFLRLDYYTKTPDFYQTNYNDNFYRNFGISFNYKFGKLNSDIKKNKRGISNDDTSGGSRN